LYLNISRQNAVQQELLSYCHSSIPQDYATA
jgi:hypothetical protein